MKKNNFTLLKMLLLFGMIPLGSALIAFSVLTYINVTKLVHKNVRNELYICNTEFNQYISTA